MFELFVSARMKSSINEIGKQWRRKMMEIVHKRISTTAPFVVCEFSRFYYLASLRPPQPIRAFVEWKRNSGRHHKERKIKRNESVISGIQFHLCTSANTHFSHTQTANSVVLAESANHSRCLVSLKFFFFHFSLVVALKIRALSKRRWNARNNESFIAFASKLFLSYFYFSIAEFVLFGFFFYLLLFLLSMHVFAVRIEWINFSIRSWNWWQHSEKYKTALKRYAKWIASENERPKDDTHENSWHENKRNANVYLVLSFIFRQSQTRVEKRKTDGMNTEKKVL